jgi:hypothetical protein
MSDIKLFKLADVNDANSKIGVEELSGQFAKLEKDLQQLVEQQMDVFLGVRFL